MDLSFTEEQEMLRTQCRDFLAKECPKKLIRQLEFDEKGYSQELWLKMSQLGWMGIPIPEEYGGTGGSFLDLAIVLEEMGRACLSSPFFSTVILGALPLIDWGTNEQKEEWLSKISSGQVMATLALTETSASWEAKGVETTADKVGEKYRISGTKLFVPFGHVADLILCVARVKSRDKDDGIKIFIVDTKRSKGVSCELLKTMSHDRLCEVTFVDIETTEGDVLGNLSDGWNTVQKIVAKAAVARCFEMLGGYEEVLAMTLAYAKERVQYGRPIGSFQVIQHYLADMWVNLMLARYVSYKVAWEIDKGLPFLFRASVAKAWVSDVYRQATRFAVQIHGAIGMTEDYDLSLYYRKAKTDELAFGDAAYHRKVVASMMGL